MPPTVQFSTTTFRAIAREIASSNTLKLSTLREENAVVRNLLRDLLENEESLQVQQLTVTKDDLPG